MAALSRGLGLALSQRIFSFAPTTASKCCSERPMARVSHAVRRSPIIQAARNLQTSARLQASKRSVPAKPMSTPTAKPKQQVIQENRTPSPANNTVNPAAEAPASASSGPLPTAARIPANASGAVANKLAARGRPTTIYKSASHFWLRFSSVSAAFFCIAYAGVNYYTNVMFPPPGLAWYVPLAYSLVCLFMGLVGYLFLISTARIVSRITAVPTASLPAAYLRPGRAKMSLADEQALRALQASPIALECDVGGALPLLGNRKIVAAPSEVVVPFKWVQAPVSRGVVPPGGVFVGFRRGLLAEGFAPIMIKGKRYKIDVLTGKVFDHGRSPDHLMPYKPDKFSDTWLDRLLKR
ncbi:unnamed protein product [Discula destructiva]